MSAIRLLIVDDQLLFLDLMEQMLKSCPEVELVSRAMDGFEAVDLAGRHKPDVVLMDLKMPGCGGIEATKLIKRKDPGIKVLVLTASSEDDDVSEAMSVGADGYLLKNCGKADLLLAIQGVHQNLEIMHGSLRKKMRPAEAAPMNIVVQDREVTVHGIAVTLTTRELEVLSLIVEGKSTGEMAAALYLSPGRVRNIITEILAKLQLKDRAQLAVYALKNRLVAD